jgi:hypothetical protein
MRSRPLTQPTFEELLARVRDLPEGYRGQVFNDAVVVSEPPTPARAHSIAEISGMFVAGSALGDPVPEGWTFLANVEISAGHERLLLCDVAGWNLTREGLLATCSPIRITPDWICEVLGGSSRRFTLSAKRRALAEMGVTHLWIADPEARVLDVFKNERGKWMLLDSLTEETAATAPPFDGLHFDVGELWTRIEIKPPPSSRRRTI